MTSKFGLIRSDGRPARQYGEEIIEPGEEFSDETLDVIRSLVDVKDGSQDAERESAEMRKSQSSSEGGGSDVGRQPEQTLEAPVPEVSRECDLPSEAPPAIKPLLHFSEKQPDDEITSPTDWVSRAHHHSNRNSKQSVLWQMDMYARGAAVVFLAVVAVWAF